MSLYYLNFADEAFAYNQAVAVHAAQMHGIANIISHTETTLRQQFPDYFSEHAGIVNLPRGFGYWLWKPYLINYYLRNLPEDAMLMYADVGVIFSASVQPIAECLFGDTKQLFFNMPKHTNGAWCKRDVFVALGVDAENVRHAPQVKAQWHFWRVCDDSRQKASEWLSWAGTDALITDAPSSVPNYPEFIEHRHDQAILSLLVQKWGNELFRDPTQEGEPYRGSFPNSPYPLTALAAGKLTPPT